jgi:hypothetical protein
VDHPPRSRTVATLPSMLATSLALSLAVFAAPVTRTTETRIPADTGWRVVALDLDLTLGALEKRVQLSGRARVRFDGDSTSTLAFRLNGGPSLMRFESATASGFSAEFHDSLPGNPGAHVARFLFGKLVHAGDEVDVAFVASSRGRSFLFAIDSTAAFLDRESGWYPALLKSGGADRVDANTPPGSTTIRLPAGWRSLSNGLLRSRSATSAGAVEHWETMSPAARSVAAGPWDTQVERFGTHSFMMFRIRPLSPAKRKSMSDIARRATVMLRALENRLGPFPYQKYGVAEIPDALASWWGNALGDMWLARSEVFSLRDGGLGIFGHEAAHAWWGNAVVPEGPGGLLLSEGLAQFSHTLALASPRDSAFGRSLEFPAEGGPPNHGARGWFAVWRAGKDKPLSFLERGKQDDYDLSLTKGQWVLHMLHERIGDSTMFAVLRELIRQHSRTRTLTLAETREAFLRAVPNDTGLATFLGQWLDRAGAPVLDYEVEDASDDKGEKTKLVITQRQTGDPYELDVPFRFDDALGSQTKKVHIRGRETIVVLPVRARTAGVELDPLRTLLLWRPEYGPAPTR